MEQGLQQNTVVCVLPYYRAKIFWRPLIGNRWHTSNKMHWNRPGLALGMLHWDLKKLITIIYILDLLQHVPFAWIWLAFTCDSVAGSSVDWLKTTPAIRSNWQPGPFWEASGKSVSQRWISLGRAMWRLPQATDLGCHSRAASCY